MTEDPSHPKIVWPSPSNCPECRGGSVDYSDTPVSAATPVPIGGHLWNVEATAAYIIRVYREENIVPNNESVVDGVRGI